MVSRITRRVETHRKFTKPPDKVCCLSLLGGSYNNCEGMRCYLFTPHRSCALVETVINIREWFDGKMQ